MWVQISEIFRRAAIRTADNVANFLPGLVVLLVILLGAFLVALSVRMILLRILRGVEFDRRAQQLGLAVLSDWSPTAGPSVLVGRTAMWVILVLGLLVGISALDATMPAQFALSVFQYVPNVLAALAILIGGHLISRFLARSVLIAAVNLQMQSARLLSAGVKSAEHKKPRKQQSEVTLHLVLLLIAHQSPINRSTPRVVRFRAAQLQSDQSTPTS